MDLNNLIENGEYSLSLYAMVENSTHDLGVFINSQGQFAVEAYNQLSDESVQLTKEEKLKAYEYFRAKIITSLDSWLDDLSKTE